MDKAEQLPLAGISAYIPPVIGMDGVWGSPIGQALRESLYRGDADNVMNLVGGLSVPALADTLREAGFTVPDKLPAAGREALLSTIQHDLIKAINLKVDGHGLAQAGQAQAPAAKLAHNYLEPKRYTDMGYAASFIQHVMDADSIEVNALGEHSLVERKSMLFVAAEALQGSIQGFGFDGIPGKYELPASMSMPEVMQLHRNAAAAVAVESFREGIGTWAEGRNASNLSEWVPETSRRVLLSGLSENSATMLIRSLENGTIAQHGSDIGAFVFAQNLAAQGYDVDAPTVDQQAGTLGLNIIEPDKQKGKYIGPVVGVDHRAGLVKYARSNAIIVPFKSMPDGQPRLKHGDMARVDFKLGIMSVAVSERTRQEIGR